MYKIAILDDLINVNVSAIFPTNIKYFVSKYVYTNPYQFSHSTKIINILSQLSSLSDIELDNLVVLNQERTSTIETLSKALLYCFHSEYNLLLMSLGTVRPSDANSLYKIVKYLLCKNTIIIAAISNDNYLTFPASFPGVIGVRYDFNLIYQHNAIHYVSEDALNSNLLVSYDFSTFGKEYHGCNSMSVPIVASAILNMLPKVKNCNVVNNLFKKTLAHTDMITSLTDLFHSPSAISTLPEVFIIDRAILDYINIENIFNEFLKNGGYEVLALSEIDTFDPRIINLNAELIRQIFFRRLFFLYCCDILIIFINKPSVIIENSEHYLRVIATHNGIEITSPNGKVELLNNASTKELVKISIIALSAYYD